MTSDDEYELVLLKSNHPGEAVYTSLIDVLNMNHYQAIQSMQIAFHTGEHVIYRGKHRYCKNLASELQEYNDIEVELRKINNDEVD